MADENAEIFAYIGRKQIELENSRMAFTALNQEYVNLLTVLSKMLTGEIDLDRVSINLEAKSWAIAPESAPVEQPASHAGWAPHDGGDPPQ